MRTFIAVPLPREVKDQLSQVSSRLRKLELDASIPRVDSIHLTLKFLGEIEESQSEEIGSLLNPIGAQTPGFELTARELGVFPHLGNPRVVWAGIVRNQGLWALQEQVEAELARIGFEAENRAFKPHLTLARIKSRRNIARLIHMIEEEGRQIEFGTLPVTEFRLYRSVLKPQGAEYSVLSTFSLKEI